MSKIENKKKNITSIGGQAVIEGVMMRGKTAMVTSVRDEQSVIRQERKRIKPLKERNFLLRLPIVRGVVAFVSSLVGGTGVLLRSAEVFGEGEPSKFENFIAKKLKIDVVKVISFLSLFLGLLLSVFLFIWLPQFIRGGLEKIFDFKFSILTKNLFEGLLKLLIFTSYILLSSLLKDTRRTFMYHGAEHKTISCYEEGLELTVENVKNCSRVHERCGTTFIFLVMLISILVFALTESLIGTSIENLYRILLKLALLPIVAGLSYELLKFLAKFSNPLLIPLKLPGLLLQRITTKEPTDDMIEVAISSFNTVLLMDGDPSIKEQDFIVPKKLNQLTNEIKKVLLENGIDEEAEAEWIVSLVAKVKRDQLNSSDLVSIEKVEKIYKIVNERITGRPLWYCIGDTEFYGYTIKVDERVLIPRPETELLVYESLKLINANSTVLDLCTGSGAIAIAIKKESDATVTAIDVSEDALSLASENATLNGAEVEFIKSDLFTEIANPYRRFDVIVTNPPYIRSEDILSLQREVKDFEPRLALDGGEDGFDFYKIIAENSKKHLNEGGAILLECGYDQAKIIAEMFSGFSKVEIIKDYENKDRIIKAVL